MISASTLKHFAEIDKSLSYDPIHTNMGETDVADNSGFQEEIMAIRQNDEAALQRLYVANYPRIETFIINNSGTADQAKDIFQEAFIAMWRNIQLDKFTARSNHALAAYLYQIARNKWMDYLRSGHFTKIVRMDAANVAEPVVNELPQDDQQYLDAVKKQFVNLGDNCRKILSLYYYGNESMKSIAGKMGWTEATTKNNKYRCIQKLRELINQ